MKNEQLPLVSIGVPVYNGNSKKNLFSIDISKSLKSILNQSYPNIEVIISDNALSDKIIFAFSDSSSTIFLLI